MCISPVTTVIFPKSETAMLSNLTTLVTCKIVMLFKSQQHDEHTKKANHIYPRWDKNNIYCQKRSTENIVSKFLRECPTGACSESAFDA